MKKNHTIYFTTRESSDGKISAIKVGITSDLNKRMSSYNGYTLKYRLIHTIDVSSKKIALAMERGFCRILGSKTEIFTGREEFVFNDDVNNLLKSWDISL